MPVEIKVPQLGESIVEATVGRWLKQEGDAVAVGDPLVELETDKVNMEVSSTSAGTLQSILKKEGETVNVDEVLATVEEGQPGASPASSEASHAQESPAAERTSSQQPRAGEDQSQSAAQGDGEGGRSTPLARRIAAEHGVDISQITGSGPSGRVTRDDVTAYLESGDGETTPPVVEERRPAAPPPSPAAPPSEAAPADTSMGRPEERIRMTRRRQTIARRLVEAQQTAAMLTTFNEVDMTAIMELRKRRRDAFKERHGIGLGFMSFFTRASIGALKAFPLLNAEIQGNEIVVKHYYDIGIAVGTDEGLVVPVVRDADRLTFAEIERQIAELADRARKQQLSLAELQGGTFTITNGGIYGSLMSTPILNTPQVGILGMHKIQERPVALGGEIVIRPMMYLALSYDHRIVDGSEAVRFLVRIKELIEDPESLLLEG